MSGLIPSTVLLLPIVRASEWFTMSEYIIFSRLFSFSNLEFFVLDGESLNSSLNLTKVKGSKIPPSLLFTALPTAKR